MTFVLQDVKLYDYINRLTKQPPKLIKILKDEKDGKKCIYYQWEKIENFDLNIFKTATKILRIYSNIIQKEFFDVKISTK